MLKYKYYVLFDWVCIWKGERQVVTDKLVNKKLGKKIKFALIMKKPKVNKVNLEKGKGYDYVEVRTLEELRENFDIEEVMESFLDKHKDNKQGECKLSEWLDDRYYNKAADVIRQWRETYDKKIKYEEENSPLRMQMFEEIYKIFGVDIEPDRNKIANLNLNKIKDLDEKEGEIKRLTTDKSALNNIPLTALNQDEMDVLSREFISQIGKNRNNYICLLSTDNVGYDVKYSYLDNIRYVGAKNNSGMLPKIKIYKLKSKSKPNKEYMTVSEVKEDIVNNRKNSLSNLIILAAKDTPSKQEKSSELQFEEIHIEKNFGGLQNSSEWFTNKESNSFEDVRTRVIRYMDAGFPLIYFNTFEEDKADEIIKAVAGNRKIYEWTAEGFFEKICREDDKWIIKAWESDWTLPHTMQMLSKPIIPRANSNSTFNEDFSLNSSVLVLKDAQYILQEKDNQVAARLKYLSQLIYQGVLKDFNIFIIANQLEVPKVLENYMTMLKLGYLTVDEIKKLIKDFCDAQNVDLDLESKSDKAFLSQLANSLKGLSEFDIVNILALAVSSERKLEQSNFELIKDQKKQKIQKTNIMELVEVTETKESIGGLENLTKWLEKKAIVFNKMEKAKENGVEIPKGILIVGMPGCGKSLTAKATAAIFNLPLLKMDMGRIMGKYVGESEANMRRALNLAETSSPCVLWIDEVEKAFAGISSNGGGGEVATRLFGTFLTWMQEKKAAAFVVATANNVSGLPPELLRKGRFDEIFYVGLPNAAERKEIFRIHIEKLNSHIWHEFWTRINDKNQKKSNDNIIDKIKNKDKNKFSIDDLIEWTRGYSGAEIAGIVREVVERVFIEGEKNTSDVNPYDIDLDLFKQVIDETSSSSKMRSIQVTLQNSYKNNNFKRASNLEEDDADNWVKILGQVGTQLKSIGEHSNKIRKIIGLILKALLWLLEMFLLVFDKLLIGINGVLEGLAEGYNTLKNKTESVKVRVGNWWTNRGNNKNKKMIESEGDESVK